MIYKKYFKDYVPEIQRILKEEHGIDMAKPDIQAIGVFPIRNIALSLLRGDEVILEPVDFLYRKKKLKRMKQARERNPQ